MKNRTAVIRICCLHTPRHLLFEGKIWMDFTKEFTQLCPAFVRADTYMPLVKNIIFRTQILLTSIINFHVLKISFPIKLQYFLINILYCMYVYWNKFLAEIHVSSSIEHISTNFRSFVCMYLYTFYWNMRMKKMLKCEMKSNKN